MRRGAATNDTPKSQIQTLNRPEDSFTLPSAVATSHGPSGHTIIETDDVSCSEGTSFAARIKTLTNKNMPIYGLSVTVH